jgi:hypothetical protein
VSAVPLSFFFPLSLKTPQISAWITVALSFSRGLPWPTLLYRVWIQRTPVPNHISSRIRGRGGGGEDESLHSQFATKIYGSPPWRKSEGGSQRHVCAGPSPGPGRRQGRAERFSSSLFTFLLFDSVADR